MSVLKLFRCTFTIFQVYKIYEIFFSNDNNLTFNILLKINNTEVSYILTTLITIVIIF